MTRILLALLALCALLPATATAAFPDTIAIPDDYQAEGIATGKGATFYAGSRTGGSIYKGSYRTGKGRVIVPARAERSATGLKLEPRSRLLYVSGAGSKQINVYDGRTGAEVRTYPLPEAGFINDVVITRRAAYFTDSQVQVLYLVALRRNGWPGRLTTLPITGEFVDGPGFNANGIDASPDGRRLIIVKSSDGTLYEAIPGASTVATREIPLDLPVTNGDGILLQGRTLYVVQNRDNRIAVVRLDSRWHSADLRSYLVDPSFDVPTTIAPFGKVLYAVNGRFPPEGNNRNPREDVVRVRR